MSDNTKKLLITILNVAVMVINAIIAYLTKDVSNVVAVSALGFTGVNCALMV